MAGNIHRYFKAPSKLSPTPHSVACNSSSLVDFNSDQVNLQHFQGSTVANFQLGSLTPRVSLKTGCVWVLSGECWVCYVMGSVGVLCHG